MKSNLIIEIETPDKLEVFPEEGQTDEDFKGKEKELQDFRDGFVKGLHENIIDEAKKHFDDSCFEEGYLDNVEEYHIDAWDSFEDYGIKIQTKVVEDVN